MDRMKERGRLKEIELLRSKTLDGRVKYISGCEVKRLQEWGSRSPYCTTEIGE